MKIDLRSQLVEIALKWQERYGVAPAITSSISEYDAARIIGMSDQEYSLSTQQQTAVQQGYDFVYQGIRYQVKANRPSGKPGSKVTKVPKASNYKWDVLIWILYDKHYEIVEAWAWDVAAYNCAFDLISRLSPDHYRGGKWLLTDATKVTSLDMHFLEKIKLQKAIDFENDLWESGFWPISVHRAQQLIGQNIYFHHDRSMTSYMGGLVTDYYQVKQGRWKSRVVFIFKNSESHVGLHWKDS